MPVESVTTPKRIPLVYQNVSKIAKEKIEQEGLPFGASSFNPLLIIEGSTCTY